MNRFENISAMLVLFFSAKYTLRVTRKTVQTCFCVFVKTLLVLFYWVAPRDLTFLTAKTLTFFNWYCHYNRIFPFFVSQHFLLLVSSTTQKELGIRNVHKTKILPHLKRTWQTWGKKGGTERSQRWQGLLWWFSVRNTVVWLLEKENSPHILIFSPLPRLARLFTKRTLSYNPFILQKSKKKKG